jgi:hypothetical protein
MQKLQSDHASKAKDDVCVIVLISWFDDLQSIVSPFLPAQGLVRESEDVKTKTAADAGNKPVAQSSHTLTPYRVEAVPSEFPVINVYRPWIETDYVGATNTLQNSSWAKSANGTDRSAAIDEMDCTASTARFSAGKASSNSTQSSR